MVRFQKRIKPHPAQKSDSPAQTAHGKQTKAEETRIPDVLTKRSGFRFSIVGQENCPTCQKKI